MTMRRRKPQFWESAMTETELRELSAYNADRRRLVFRPEYVERMAELQARFDTARAKHYGIEAA